SRGHAPVHRGRLARFLVGGRDLPRHGLRAARFVAAAIHRPLFHGRLSHGADRSGRARHLAAPIVIARRSQLTPPVSSGSVRAPSCRLLLPTASRLLPALPAVSATPPRSPWPGRAPMSSRSREPLAAWRSLTMPSGPQAAPQPWFRWI